MRKGILLALSLGALSAPMFGAIIIDFGRGSGTGGTIEILGSEVVGINIPVDVMQVTNGTVTNYDTFGGGTTPATGDTNGTALVNFDTKTGVFNIVGGVCAVGNTTCSSTVGTPFVASTTLALGTGSSATILFLGSSSLTFDEKDTKATTLLSALGLPTNLGFNLMDAQFGFTDTGTKDTKGPLVGAEIYTVTSTDVQNTAVPEPTSVLLFGTVLFGVTGLIRRRSKKA